MPLFDNHLSLGAAGLQLIDGSGGGKGHKCGSIEIDYFLSNPKNRKKENPSGENYFQWLPKKYVLS